MTATVTPIRPGVQADAGEGLNAVELCVAAGISYRQCDHWSRVGLIHAIGQDTPGTGYARRYNDTEVRIAGLMKRLLDIGLLPQGAARYARQVVVTGQPVTLAGGLVRIDPAAVVDL
jgi:hypothetical protein